MDKDEETYNDLPSIHEDLTQKTDGMLSSSSSSKDVDVTCAQAEERGDRPQTQPSSPSNQRSGSPLSQPSDSPSGQESDNPVNQRSDSAVSQLSGSPSNQQFGLPWLQEQDEKTPTSPASSIGSSSSLSSTDEYSPSGTGTTRRSKRTQEFDAEEKRNHSLHEEKINLLRQKGQAKNKVDLLEKIFYSMTHCRCCMDDYHEKLIQEGDYSFNISLDENTLQSSYSQNGLAKESLEDVVYCTAGDPVMNLPAPSNSMTNPDGEFTSELLGLEFIQQIRRSSENPNESMTTYDVTERHEWLNQPDWTGSMLDTQNTNPSYYQKIREVNKIAADLEADVNACFPKKRRNSLEDANEHCIKNTKQDHRIAISTPLREKNEQENVSITEQKHIRCIPTTGSRRRRHVIRKEVCIKPNEEKTAVPSTVETSDNETAVKSVVESLSEKFTSAVSLNNTEDCNLAADATETVKDVKPRAQSGRGETQETETSSTAKTEEVTIVSLLEQSMKTLSVDDTNEKDHAKSNTDSTAKTEDDSLLQKTKKTVDAVGSSMKETDLIKETKESLTADFVTAKKENNYTAYNTLVKKNDENVEMNDAQSQKTHKPNDNDPNSVSDESYSTNDDDASRPTKNGDVE